MYFFILLFIVYLTFDQLSLNEQNIWTTYVLQYQKTYMKEFIL